MNYLTVQTTEQNVNRSRANRAALQEGVEILSSPTYFDPSAASYTVINKGKKLAHVWYGPETYYLEPGEHVTLRVSADGLDFPEVTVLNNGVPNDSD